MAAVETRPPRRDKVAVVDGLTKRFEDSSAILLSEYRGMKVKDLQTLRRGLREVGAEYKVVKCTLARIAAHDAGLDGLIPLLQGPIAFTFVDGDAAASAKILRETSKQHEVLELRGGVLGGAIIDESQTKALADLPSREILLGQIAGAFKAPMRKAAGTFNAPLQKMAGLLGALEKKMSESDAA